MDQRDRATRHSQGVLGLHHLAGRAPRRCPVQPITPLGPDQVNVLLSFGEFDVVEGTLWSLPA
jgi:hypothetical protein